ncbi:MAG: DegT/DnrJ/EryC1/StrS family aminotransferase, partial [Candidatus Aminicenantales bacterium]
MNVPILDLSAQYKTIRAEVRAAIDRVCESQHFILGPEVERLEKSIAAYTGVANAVGVSSGTDALLAALMALDVGLGDEVVTSPFTFFATAGTIARLGAKIVFSDIDPVTFNIDPARLPGVIGPRTKAVIPVHLFGQCADMDPILEIAGQRNIAVIEDAAQSIGSEYKGRRAGSMGEMGIFSFFPSKNLGGFGDGGMVVSRKAEWSGKIRILRVHGSNPKYYHKIVGGNFRLDALQAAVLNVKMKYLDSWSAARRVNAAYYDRIFAESGLPARGDVVIPRPVWKNAEGGNHHIYNQYTLRCRRRNELQAYLKEKGIGTEIYYPLPLHLQECFSALGYRRGDFPESERAAAEVLSIPIYPELTSEQKEYVAGSLIEF